MNLSSEYTEDIRSLSGRGAHKRGELFMQKLSGRKLLLIGFTLFSMFFGAGNLIFPPDLGAKAGTHFWPAFLGLAKMCIRDRVYGVRSRRDTDTFFKRFTAEGFYHVMNALGADIVFNHADYRLISTRVLESFADYREVNIFLRGMVPLVGYPSDTVYYERHERLAGESHYPLSKMLALAFDGITLSLIHI